MEALCTGQLCFGAQVALEMCHSMYLSFLVTHRHWQSTKEYPYAFEHNFYVTFSGFLLTKENFMTNPKSRVQKVCEVACQRTWMCGVHMHACVCVSGAGQRQREGKKRWRKR